MWWPNITPQSIQAMGEVVHNALKACARALQKAARWFKRQWRRLKAQWRAGWRRFKAWFLPHWQRFADWYARTRFGRLTISAAKRIKRFHDKRIGPAVAKMCDFVRGYGATFTIVAIITTIFATIEVPPATLFILALVIGGIFAYYEHKRNKKQSATDKTQTDNIARMDATVQQLDMAQNNDIQALQARLADTEAQLSTLRATAKRTDKLEETLAEQKRLIYMLTLRAQPEGTPPAHTATHTITDPQTGRPIQNSLV